MWIKNSKSLHSLQTDGSSCTKTEIMESASPPNEADCFCCSRQPPPWTILGGSTVGHNLAHLSVKRCCWETQNSYRERRGITSSTYECLICDASQINMEEREIRIFRENPSFENLKMGTAPSNPHLIVHGILLAVYRTPVTTPVGYYSSHLFSAGASIPSLHLTGVIACFEEPLRPQHTRQPRTQHKTRHPSRNPSSTLPCVSEHGRARGSLLSM